MNPVNSETPPKNWIEWACQFVMGNWGLLMGLLLSGVLLALVVSALFCPEKTESLIKRCGENISARAKKYSWLSSSMAGIFTVIVLICLHEWIKENAIILGGVIAVASLLLLRRRTYSQAEQVKNQGKLLDYQIKKDIEDRFTNATNLLGSTEDSIRTAAIYSLYRLFINKDGKEYRAEIAQTLCRHIRTKTQESEYQENYKNRPSNEIQTTINLLFKGGKEESGNKGIYCGSEILWRDLPLANLEYAFLCGADFTEAHCERAEFQGAHCDEAKFQEASCEGANFQEVQCEGADFQLAHCEGADFRGANCGEANFQNAYCEGADFQDANCKEANFQWANCQGADFGGANCEGADFEEANCEGADFSYVRVGDTNFQDANFEGSYATILKEQYGSGSGRIKGQIGNGTKLEN